MVFVLQEVRWDLETQWRTKSKNHGTLEYLIVSLKDCEIKYIRLFLVTMFFQHHRSPGLVFCKMFLSIFVSTALRLA